MYGTHFLVMAVLLANACAGSGNDTDVTPGPGPKKSGFFDGDAPIDIHLGFSKADWVKFLDNWDEGRKEYVHCEFGFSGRTFNDAACRPKGNEGDWEHETKPQFLIRFNKWNEAGRFMGLRSVNLEANADHPAPVRDRLGMWLMRESGVNAPLVNHARVYLNGGYYGLYQNIEVVDREFLEDRYEDPDGNLFEKGSELKTNEGVNDTSDLDALNSLVEGEPLDGDHGDFFLALEGMVDVQQLLRETAVEAVMPTWDNFWNGSWNYYLYNAPGEGFHVIPWDLDDAMSEKAPPDADLFEFYGHAEEKNKILLLMMHDTSFRDEFLQTVDDVLGGAYAELPSMVDLYCDQIRQAHIEDPSTPADAKKFDEDCAYIKDHIEQRRTFLGK